MVKKMTREDAIRIYAVIEEKGNLPDAATELGVEVNTVSVYVTRFKRRFPDLDVPEYEYQTSRDLTDREAEQLQEALNLLAQHGNPTRAAEACGISRSTFRGRVKKAERLGFVAEIRGRDEALKAIPWYRPAKGKVKRYIVTCAQNDTLIHEPTWRALHALKDHYDAELIVSTLTYIHSQEGSAKRGTGKRSSEKGMWYDPRIEPYVCDEMKELAPNLIWNGHWNILPTAVDPLSSLENYNFRKSSIFPHVKVAMKSIPTVRGDGTKLQYTTGTVTKRNYIQKKSGQKAEFDHVYGGLIVEVTHDGAWFVRQLNVDGSGGLYDLDVHVSPRGKVKRHSGVEAIQYGDIHSIQLEPEMVEATWGEGGMLDALKPKYQFMHDLIDFEARSHHNLRDPFKVFDLHVKGRGSVKSEVENVGEFLRVAKRPRCKTVIVQSNHDLHFERWLRDTSWKQDPENALLHSQATTAFLESIHAGEPFNALRWALDKYSPVDGLTWADPEDGFIILKDQSGGIEMGLHGDKGPNGSRGSLRNLSRLGRKVCIGHSHSAGIFNGAYQSGLKARLDMEYAQGSPSSWSQTDIIVHKNGKRQLITWWKGEYRAT